MLAAAGMLLAPGVCISQRPAAGMMHMRQPAACSQQSRCCSRLSVHSSGPQPRSLPAGLTMHRRSSRNPAWGRPVRTVAEATGPAEDGSKPIKPAYNKYRSRTEIERSYLRQWQQVTARAEQGQERMTVLSALAFLPVWAKYTLVPGFLRFAWWLVWVRVLAVAHFFHRRAVKQGAKVDAFLAAKGGSQQGFSRRVVLARYHHRVNAWDNLRYRWALLRGEPQTLFQEAGPQAEVSAAA